MITRLPALKGNEVDEQTEMELGQEAQSIDHVNQREQMLEEIIARFRVLKNWDIKIEKRNGYSGNCYINLEKKQATIDDWILQQPDDYFLHEVLHIAIRSLQTREQEELLVQDICELIKIIIQAKNKRLKEALAHITTCLSLIRNEKNIVEIPRMAGLLKEYIAEQILKEK